MLLNPRQQEAVEHQNGPLLIVAGAGAGKTRVLTYRIKRLIEKGVHPSTILAITFTNKAAKEMRERVLSLLSDPHMPSPFVSTFHALGVRMLREFGEVMGIKRSFVILDRSDSLRRIKRALKDEGFDPQRHKPERILGTISKAKGDAVTAEVFAEEIDNPWKEITAIVWKRYEEAARAEHALDFDDLLLLPVELLRKNPDIQKEFHRRFQYVHVDEYQDTNRVQYELTRLLVNPRHNNLCVVGDGDQCFVPGTMIKTPKGAQPIGEIEVGTEVLSASGDGETCSSIVSKIHKKHFSGKILTIRTRKGSEVRVTPEHIFFTRLHHDPDLHYVYLMYRKDKGYRIGVVKGSRSIGERMIIGPQVRCNQENADRMWILRVCGSRSEALSWEHIYSCNYGIPTAVFHVRGRRMQMSQDHVDMLYNNVDTARNIKNLFENERLYFQYPHYLPEGTTNGNTKRSRVNLRLTMFSDRRKSEQSPWGLSRVSLNTTDRELREKLEKAGFSTRKGKRDDWRLEYARLDYGDAEVLADKLLEVDDSLSICRTAVLTEQRKRFSFLPAGSLRPSMEVAFYEDGRIQIDQIENIQEEMYEGDVYDLDVGKTHNYIAENIVVHNCIYTWRGANMKNIIDFESDFPTPTTVLLEENYRSTQTILDAANFVISKNVERVPKKLFTSNTEGGKIHILQSWNEQGEASRVLDEVETLLASHVPADEIAILYRANYQSRVLEEACLNRGISYQLLGTRFYERKEVKDMISYLRAALNPDSWEDIARIINTPKRGIGAKTLEKVRLGEQETLSPRLKKEVDDFYNLLANIRCVVEKEPLSKALGYILNESGLKADLENDGEEGLERLENISELISLASFYDEQTGLSGAEEFLAQAALATDQDDLSEDKGGIKLMTVHASKGLEFDAVFVTGLEEGLFPQERDDESLDREEERRLMYVAITRARHHLFLSWARSRRIFGSEQFRLPSQFLSDIDPELCEGDIPEAEPELKIDALNFLI